MLAPAVPEMSKRVEQLGETHDLISQSVYSVMFGDLPSM